MRLRLLVLFILLPLVSYSQRESANWYFGTNAGLDFNSGFPEPLLDGALTSNEGCASISSADGNLLFYTDAQNVWNRGHTLMPNGTGLNGSLSSTQSALIIPQPGSSSRYYIFTSDAVQAYQEGGSGNGFNYSVVDMSLLAGTGDVISKNNTLLSQGSEKVTGVLAADGVNYWIITHNANRFYSFFLDDTGISTTPVVSTIGLNIDNFNNKRGGIKVSPQGNKLAIAHTIFEPTMGGSLRLYDFNDATGEVSNEIVLAEDLIYYGLEFSANGRYLYSSAKELGGATDLTSDINIVQFNVNAPDVVATRYLVADIPNPFQSDLAGTLQMGLDRKIYHAIPNIALSVIRSPNLDGPDSDFRLYEVSLGGKSATFGLPPFVQSFFESFVEIEFFCLGDETSFTVTTDDPVVAVNWNFGDPASGADNTSAIINPTHVFTSTGVFTVTADVTFATRAPKRFVEFIEIGGVPDVNFGVNFVQCDIDGLEDGISEFNLEQIIPLLLDDPEGFEASFFDNLTDAENNENPIESIGYRNTMDGQVIYARVFENPTCFAIAPVTLFVEPMAYVGDIELPACNRSDSPEFEFTVDLTDVTNGLLDLFPGAEFTYFKTREDALLELDPYIDSATFSLEQTIAMYFRAEVANACLVIGRVLLDVRSSPQNAEEDIFICPNETDIRLYPGDFFAYSWSTGETTSSINVDGPGTYTVSVFNGTGCDGVFIFNVISLPLPDELFIVVEDFKDRNQVTVLINDPDPFGFSYDDTAIQDSNVLIGVPAGLRTIRIWSDDCLVYSEQVFVGGAPNYFTPNGDGINDRWHLFNSTEFRDASVYIYDRFGKFLKRLNYNDAGWDGTYRGNPMPSSDYWYRIELLDGRVARGHFSLIRR